MSAGGWIEPRAPRFAPGVSVMIRLADGRFARSPHWIPEKLIDGLVAVTPWKWRPTKYGWKADLDAKPTGETADPGFMVGDGFEREKIFVCDIVEVVTVNAAGRCVTPDGKPIA